MKAVLLAMCVALILGTGRADVAGITALPLIEVPPAQESSTAPLMVMMSGDGGWAEFVRTISQRLAGDGWAVVGLDMRKFLKVERTPEETARAVEAIVSAYGERWHRDRIVVAGFSRGADIAPFVVNRMTADFRERVALVLLLSPGRNAEFEFHWGDFLRKPKPDSVQPVAVEVDRLGNRPILMLYGHDDDEAIELPAHTPPGRAIRLPGDHHMNRDYDTIVKLIRAAYPHGATVAEKAEALKN